jgi:hypothetical protein
MKRTAKSGCKITYAPFWLSRCQCQGETYLRVTTEMPRTGNPEPLSEREAYMYWCWRDKGAGYPYAPSETGVYWSESALDYFELIRDSIAR